MDPLDGSSPRPAVVGSVPPMRALSKLVAIGLFVTRSLRWLLGLASRPARKHFDDMYIARHSARSEGRVVETQNRMVGREDGEREGRGRRQGGRRAAHQVAATITRPRACDRLRDLQQEERRAVGRQRTGSTTRTKELHAAEDSAKAADARVKYYEAYRGYLEALLALHAGEHVLARGAVRAREGARSRRRTTSRPRASTTTGSPSRRRSAASARPTAKSKAEAEKSKAVRRATDWLKAAAGGRQGDRPHGRAPRSDGPQAAAADGDARRRLLTAPADLTPQPTPAPAPAPAPAPGTAHAQLLQQSCVADAAEAARILVVDDERVIREILAEFLTLEGLLGPHRRGRREGADRAAPASVRSADHGSQDAAALGAAAPREDRGRAARRADGADDRASARSRPRSRR